MTALDMIANVWKNLQELDLRPIREAAEKEARFAIVGGPGTGKHTLAAQMRTDPRRAGVSGQTPILLATPDNADRAAEADAIIIMVRAGNADPAAEPILEETLARQWVEAGKHVLLFLNQFGPQTGMWPGWPPAPVVSGAATDRAFLENTFAPAVAELLPDRHLALGRHFPLFRLHVARQLINETCTTNATYAAGTGLAEIVPLLDLPLNAADMLVLTKGQALLVYKLGLALGLPKDWQYYVTEFGGVVGGGFLWRQLARSLVGLIPGWGIIPKVAIAYAGTYVVGEVVLQWYLTGRHASREQLNDLYRQAFAQGRQAADTLARRVPRPQLPRVRLPRVRAPRLPAARLPLIHRTPKELPVPFVGPVCKQCGTPNDPDAAFCKHCGQPLSQPQ